jgi:aminocarboxymuconate-semialdehyde decarboxylase
VVVDIHAHVIAPGFGVEGPPAAVREFSDLPRILEQQDRSGVDVVVLCPWVRMLDLEPERQNEALAAMRSERVEVLGTCPVDRPELLAELMGDGRFAGVEIAASSGDDYPGSDRYREFWAAAEETGALVFVHPTTNAFPQAIFQRHYLFNLVGNPVETTLAAADMVISGVMDDHPALKVVLAHGGGAITTLRGRVSHAQTFKPPGRDVLAGLRRFFYDTVVFDPGVLRALVEFAGVERVLLGSDYPFDMGDDRPAEVVRALGLPADEEEAILSGNARRLLARA